MLLKRLCFAAGLFLYAPALFSQVGINTTAPNAQLEIRATNQAAPSNTDGIIIPKIDAFPAVNPTSAQQGMMVYLTTSYAGKRPGFYYWDNSGAIWTPVGGNKGWEVSGNSGTTPATNFIGTTDAQPLAFRTNNAEQLRISDAGNVGIGTTNPQNKLHVMNAATGMTPNPASVATIENTTPAYFSLLSNSESGLLFGSNGNSSNGGIIYNNGALADAMQFRTNGNVTRMVLGPTGNLGMGLTTPQFPLHFSYSLGDKISLWGGTGIHYGLGIQDHLLQIHTDLSTSDVVFGHGQSSALNETMRIKGTGSVGIGLSNPSSRLHVYKGASGMVTNPGSSVTLEDDTENYLSLLSGTESGILFGANGNSTNGAIIYNNPPNPDGLLFRTGGNATRMAITSGGNVGVGNFIPNARMHIIASNAATPANNDGIIIPRVGAFPASNPTAVHDGMMIYLATAASGKLPGFYYWDNPAASWKGVGANSGWSMTGNAGTTPGTHFIGTTDDKDLVIKRNSVRIGQLGATNIALGTDALLNNTANVHNVAIGGNTLKAAAPGNYNVAVGLNALEKNTFSGSVGIGNNALNNNSSGEYNVAVGTNALRLNDTGAYNTAVGFNALYNNTGHYNTAFGVNAIASNEGGIQNAGHGFNTLYYNKTGTYNSAFGNGAMYFNVDGSYNTAVGYDSLHGNQTGINNVSVGLNSYFTNTAGNNNTILGTGAMYWLASGNNNVALGMEAMNGQTAGSNNIALGKGANVPSLTGSDQLSIGNTIYGTGMASATAKIGIKTNNPTADLEVNGYTKLGSSAPAIKNLKLTGITSNSQGGSVNIAHGLTSTKILSVSIMLEYAPGSLISSSYNGSTGYEFDYYINATNIVVWNKAGNSGSILSKSFKILVTYEE
jgi:hypothetical protein